MTAHPPRSVFILEDERVIALDLKEAMEEKGYRVEGPAGSLEDARRILAGCRPDVALLDIRLGSRTSFALAERLVRGGTKVVFVSGHGPAGMPSAVRDCPFLQKPVASSEIAQVVDDL